jgi:hexosaminidase
MQALYRFGACVSIFFVLLISATAQQAALWPQPQQYECAPSILLSINSLSFEFTPTGASSSILSDAIKRYQAVTFIPIPAALPLSGTPSAALTSLAINVLSADETLGIATYENYTLSIPASGGQAVLTAQSVFGAIRGLETFSQLVSWSGPGVSAYIVGSCAVTDWPRFPYRSAMVDSSRHFVPLVTLRAFIDAMAYSKMNVSRSDWAGVLER